MVDLEYLPALIPLIAVFYGLIVYTFKRLEKWCDEKDEYCALSTGFASTPDENQASTIGFSEYSIKSSYMCLFITGRAGQYVLLTTRLICFLYFFCIALTWYVQYPLWYILHTMVYHVLDMLGTLYCGHLDGTTLLIGTSCSFRYIS